MKRGLFLALALFFVVIFAAQVWAATNDAALPLYAAINSKPPSVLLINAEKLQSVATISLEQRPLALTWSGDHKYVYVLCSKDAIGFFQSEGTVAIIDVAKQTLLKTIKIGWNPNRTPIASLSGRYVGYYCKGRSGSKKDAEENAALWLIDTTTNELANVYRSTRYIPLIGYSSIPYQGYAASSPDFERLILFSQMEGVEPKKADSPRPTLSVFAREKADPIAVLEFDHPIRQTAFSADYKLLYVLDPGVQSNKPDKKREGKLFVVDMTTGKIAKEHAVGANPRWLEPDTKNNSVLLLSGLDPDNKGVLYRIQGTELTSTEVPITSPLFTRELENLDGRLLVSETEIRQLDDKATSVAIPINKAEKSDKAGPYLEGTPSEMVYFPAARRLVVSVINSYGESTGNIGVIDTENKKVLARISTGHLTSLFLKQLAMAAGSGMVQGYNAAYGTHLYAPTGGIARPSNNMTLWPEPAGKLAYAFNISTGELHVIQLSDGTVSKVIKLPKEKLQLADGGQYLLGGSSTLAILDLKSGEMREMPVAGGKIKFVTFDQPRQRALVFTHKSLVVIDYANAKQLGSIDQFDNELLFTPPLAE